MAHFRATIRGQRGEASRLGGAKSGLTANVNGWDIGVRVEAEVTKGGKDVLYVTVTGGSNGSRRTAIIARVMESGVTLARDGSNDIDSWSDPDGVEEPVDTHHADGQCRAHGDYDCRECPPRPED